MIFYNEKFVEKKKMYFILKLLLYIKNIYIIIFYNNAQSMKNKYIYIYINFNNLNL